MTILKKGDKWNSHTRYRAATRNLRHRIQRFLDSNDPVTIAVVERCRLATENDPEPTHTWYHLMVSALDAHEGTGVPWVDAMNYLLDKFEERSTNESSTEVVGRHAEV